MSGTASFVTLLRVAPFRWFWSGFTTSSVGDAMTSVALVWFVYETTGSVATLGLFAFVSTAPVLVGGFFAGYLLDRFDRRTVMFVDSVFRGCVVGAVPLLHAAGLLSVWHVFAVGGIHGLLKMIAWAGGPSVVPELVPHERLDTANAMEMLGLTISGVLGPAIAGALIPLIGAPNILVFDAASYAAFALALTRIPAMPPRRAGVVRRGFADAFGLLVRQPVILSTTLMFMVANIGQGLLFVALPVLAAGVLRGGPELYGILLGAIAMGEIVGSLAAGGVRWRLPIGALIALSQICSGLVLLPAAFYASIPVAIAALFGLGVFSAPLTIWAQTLRMRIIPAELRGRTFALLRTLMQGTIPAGGAAAGYLLPLIGVPALMLAAAMFVGGPGALGILVAPLRRAGHEPASEVVAA